MLDKFNRQALIDSGFDKGFDSGFDSGFDKGYRNSQVETVRRLREEGMSDEFIRKIIDMSSEEWPLL